MLDLKHGGTGGEPARRSDRSHRGANTRRLVAGIVAGDETAFAQLYAQYHARVCTDLARTSMHYDDVHELAQIVFTKAWSAIRAGQYGGQPFEAWLVRIARNAAIDRWRREARIDLLPPELLESLREAEAQPDLQPETTDWIVDDDLRWLVNGLTTLQRQVVALTFLGGLTSAEVGAALGRSEGSVRVARHKALRLLAQRWSAPDMTRRRREPRLAASRAYLPRGWFAHPSVTPLRQRICSS